MISDNELCECCSGDNEWRAYHTYVTRVFYRLWWEYDEQNDWHYLKRMALDGNPPEIVARIDDDWDDTTILIIYDDSERTFPDLQSAKHFAHHHFKGNSTKEAHING